MTRKGDDDDDDKLRDAFPPNAHEKWAWRVLVSMGATETEIGGKPALDIRTVKPTRKRWAQFLQAFLEVAGRSGGVRRHVDRNGCPVFVVRDK